MSRAPGLSVRLKLTLSYAGFLVVAGALLLAVVWVFLLRYVPTESSTTIGPSGPNRYDLVRAFVPPATWAVIFLLLLGLAGGWILAGLMLAPLSRITSVARRAASGSLSHRVDLEGRSDEFRELADSFDAMLARLEAHDAEQQRFAANASHELRTPLAITQALLDVARKDPNQDAHELVERLRSVNSHAIDLTEALLLLSSADSRAFRRDVVDLSLIAEQAVETLLPFAEERKITIETAGVLVTTVGSQVLLLQLTTNLLHNAIVHNLAEGGSVRVETDADYDWVILRVENTGVVLPAGSGEYLAEPFQRGSERARGAYAGVGLGLAIVKSIARAHDGTLHLAPLVDGGLSVTVRLPAVPPESDR